MLLYNVISIKIPLCYVYNIISIILLYNVTIQNTRYDTL